MGTSQATDKINELRGSIDFIDSQLFALLSERLSLAAEIGRVKKEHKLPVIDDERESSLIHSLGTQMDGKLTHEQVKTMVTTLLALSHEVQEGV